MARTSSVRKTSLNAAWESCAADIKALDQPVFDSKHVTGDLIRQKIPVEVAHNLTYFHNHVTFGDVCERDRLDVWIDHRPLTCPVAAHFVASVDMTAFHSICPNDLLVHGSEHRLHVTSVEAVVNTFKELHFIRHSNLPSSWPTLPQIPILTQRNAYVLRRRA